MKTPIGGGSYIEPDEGKPSPFRMEIMQYERIPGTTHGYNATLACGHGVQIFGNLEMARGGVICTKCRDLSEGEATQ